MVGRLPCPVLPAGALKDKAGGEPMSAASIKALIIALPQFREVLSRLSVHISLSSDLKVCVGGGGGPPQACTAMTGTTPSIHLCLHVAPPLSLLLRPVGACAPLPSPPCSPPPMRGASLILASWSRMWCWGRRAQRRCWRTCAVRAVQWGVHGAAQAREGWLAAAAGACVM